MYAEWSTFANWSELACVLPVINSNRANTSLYFYYFVSRSLLGGNLLRSSGDVLNVQVTFKILPMVD